MKNLLVILAIIVLGAVSYGQKVVVFTNDTITDTGTATLATGGFSVGSNLTIVVTATQLTGTSAGSAVFQGSLDGVTYATISTAAVDSMTITNGATFTWNTKKVDSDGYKYYRALFTGTGTSSTKVTGKYLIYK